MAVEGRKQLPLFTRRRERNMTYASLPYGLPSLKLEKRALDRKAVASAQLGLKLHV